MALHSIGRAGLLQCAICDKQEEDASPYREDVPMSRLGPPQPGRHIDLDDNEPLRRVHFRLWQISISAVVIVVTCWSYTLHFALGLSATFLAKHILVAVLAVGLHLPPQREHD
jgi:hypothetical protein